MDPTPTSAPSYAMDMLTRFILGGLSLVMLVRFALRRRGRRPPFPPQGLGPIQRA